VIPAVATSHRAATDAGLRALERGGTAVDAALASAAVLTVVYPHNCALGGTSSRSCASRTGRRPS
jgi:gamma-glutamyltranspeptidase/glutathione hydrolase